MRTYLLLQQVSPRPEYRVEAVTDSVLAIVKARERVLGSGGGPCLIVEKVDVYKAYREAALVEESSV